VRPVSVEEAVQALAGADGARVLAGGQSLINVLKHRVAQVDLLVDISRLDELRFVDVDADGSVELGAATTYDELDRSAELRAAHPKIAEVAAGTVDQQVRCRGTVGGNTCFNDPASNFPPRWVALGATLNVAGPDGPRSVPAEAFFLGHYRVALRPGELLRSISIPARGGAGVGYASLQLAKDSWALARAVAWVRSNGTIEDARIVLGCVGPVPVRATAMEERLRGSAADPDAVRAAAAAAAEGIDPPSDAHAGGDYRRDMACVMAGRAVNEAMAGGAA
jgi:carbon-monoxide dehydrogenase medium subunit